MPAKTLTIFLTRYPSALSRFLCWYSHSDYLHASVGFGDEPGTFYSFGFNGYRVERITYYLKPERTPLPCALYELEVPERSARYIHQRPAGAGKAAPRRK